MESLLSIAEARRILGISASGFYRLIGRAEIAIVRVGGRSLVEPQALRAFIATKRTLRTQQVSVSTPSDVPLEDL